MTAHSEEAPEAGTAVTLSRRAELERARKDPRAFLYRSFMSGRSEATQRAYAQDLENFRAFVQAADVMEALDFLTEEGHGPANVTALAYRNHMIEAKLAPATVNRRLATLRSMVKLARTMGKTEWALEVPGVKSDAYRDTRGPGRSGVRAMLDLLDDREDAKGARDRAMVRLLYDLALRRAEVVALDLEDVELAEDRVWITGKGRREREPRTLSTQARNALEEWIGSRGEEPGPLFPSLSRKGAEGGRLTGDGLYKLIRKLGKRVGLTTRPHGLRHAAITDALEIHGGDYEKVADFSRHRKLETVRIYNDNRRDMAGAIAKDVGAAVTAEAEREE